MQQKPSGIRQATKGKQMQGARLEARELVLSGAAGHNCCVALKAASMHLAATRTAGDRVNSI